MKLDNSSYIKVVVLFGLLAGFLLGQVFYGSVQ